MRLPISLVRKCVLYLIIIIKSEVRTIGHYLGLGHETAVCVVCPAIFPGIVYTLSEKHIIWLKHGFRCQVFQLNLYKDHLTPNLLFCMCNKELWLWWSRQWCIGNNNSYDYKMISFDTHIYIYIYMCVVKTTTTSRLLFGLQILPLHNQTAVGEITITTTYDLYGRVWCCVSYAVTAFEGSAALRLRYHHSCQGILHGL